MGLRSRWHEKAAHRFQFQGVRFTTRSTGSSARSDRTLSRFFLVQKLLTNSPVFRLSPFFKKNWLQILKIQAMNLSVSKSSQLLSSRKGQGISCSRFRWAVPSPARNRAADPPASAPAAGGDAVVRRASRVHATDAAGVRDAARRRAAILIAERPRRSEADCGPRMAASTRTSGRAEGVLQAGECAQVGQGPACGRLLPRRARREARADRRGGGRGRLSEPRGPPNDDSPPAEMVGGLGPSKPARRCRLPQARPRRERGSPLTPPLAQARAHPPGPPESLPHRQRHTDTQRLTAGSPAMAAHPPGPPVSVAPVAALVLAAPSRVPSPPHRGLPQAGRS